MFTSIQELLPRAMSTLGIKQEMDAALVCETYRKVAPSIIHPDALVHTYPKSFQRKVLTIGIEDPAWAEQVNLKKEDLLRVLNQNLGGVYVGSIKTKVVEKVKKDLTV